MKKIIIVIFILFCLLPSAFGDDQAIKNHIDQRLREFKDLTIEQINSRTSNVTTDFKTYVDGKTEEIRVEVRGLLFSTLRKLIFGVIGGLIITIFLYRFLEKLKDRKTRDLINKRIVPNNKPPGYFTDSKQTTGVNTSREDDKGNEDGTE